MPVSLLQVNLEEIPPNNCSTAKSESDSLHVSLSYMEFEFECSSPCSVSEACGFFLDYTDFINGVISSSAFFSSRNFLHLLSCAWELHRTDLITVGNF